MHQTVALIQARMSSTRLPGKVLLPIAGEPMIFHQIQRVKASKFLDGFIVATSTEPADDPIANECAKRSWTCFRGKEEDVLDRYFEAAKHYKIANIVRLTADNPLQDPDIIDSIISEYLKAKVDYVSNTIDPSFIDGHEVEVFSFKALERAHQRASSARHREHVTLYIKENPQLFSCLNIGSTRHLNFLDWTVDHPSELKFIRYILESLKDKTPFASTSDIKHFLREQLAQ